ncbi:MAG: bifunctional phosphopantothenoylcysteine decarboxylase/phosphopantothenate--cysteine ligase CoaBC [Bacteroidia bacterium]|nr:bifunctional phosphopantothenoylcysteine decarboxylase/phosphopantothenate--cysteine ligase CoaBC [Bacteroidia bacterium]
MVLHNKKILLGITGGIAAYKCAHLVRLFIKAGADVKVIMTPAATQFVTPETLSVLSKNPVVSEFFEKPTHEWNNHVHLAEWADLILIAPATANSLAKFTTGVCDNIVTACYLSARSKVFIAPAMDLDMYQHPTTKTNLKTLETNGNIIIPAESGELASGLSGEGRMAEPENIVAFIERYFSANLPLSGKKVLVNAGPTYEAIDPVRFIGNRSSGKTGVLLADEFCNQGAEVTLVLGPSVHKPKTPSVKVIRVETADEMFNACVDAFKQSDIAVLSAAVADYKPKEQSVDKIKKSETEIKLELTKTKDILAELGKLKNKQILVGFALETTNAIEYGKEKIKKKNLDLIVVNTTSENNPAFGSDFNTVSIIDKHNNLVNFEFKSKAEIAKDIVEAIKTFSKK